MSSRCIPRVNAIIQNPNNDAQTTRSGLEMHGICHALDPRSQLRHVVLIRYTVLICHALEPRAVEDALRKSIE